MSNRKNERDGTYTTLLEQIWCPQETEYTCGLASLRMVLRYFGTMVEEKELNQVLNDVGFKVKGGIYASELGLIALRYGFDVELHIPTSSLPVILLNARERSFAPDSSEISKRLSALGSRALRQRVVRGLYDYVRAGGQMFVHKTGVSDIIDATRLGAAVIVKVHSEQYYKSYERWKHFLVAVPLNDSYAILDSYSEGIKKDYPVAWRRYLDHAQDFDWSTWHDAFVDVKPVYS